MELTDEKIATMANWTLEDFQDVAVDDPMGLMTTIRAMAREVARGRKDGNNDTPMTVEELRKAAERHEAVYVTVIGGSCPLLNRVQRWAAVLDEKQAYGSQKTHLVAIYGDNMTLWEDDYDRTWTAYRRPPEAGAGMGVSA